MVGLGEDRAIQVSPAYNHEACHWIGNQADSLERGIWILECSVLTEDNVREGIYVRIGFFDDMTPIGRPRHKKQGIDA